MVKEPLGGAHRNPQEAAANIKKIIKKDLASLKAIPKEKLTEINDLQPMARGIYLWDLIQTLA